MHLSLFVLLIFTSPITSTLNRQCGSDLSNLWLDIVIVVDNSQGMTQQGITEVAANIATVFGGSKIGTNYSDPRSSRISLVTYNRDATVVANLDQIESTNEFYETLFINLNSVVDSDDSYIATGLEAAEGVLRDGRLDGRRENYRRMVVVYAASYGISDTLDPIPIANRLKRDGVYIATVSINLDADLVPLSPIASPSFNFSSEDPHQVTLLQNAALSVNCFCSPTWSRFGGVCVHAASLTSSWSVSKLACQNMARNGYLATEFDSLKHSFVHKIATKFLPAFESYSIGLSFVNGGWYWQQPAGHGLVKLNNYTDWNPTFPKSYNSNFGVIVAISNTNNTGWQNINPHNQPKYYICEVATCDTDNYCA